MAKYVSKIDPYWLYETKGEACDAVQRVFGNYDYLTFLVMRYNNPESPYHNWFFPLLYGYSANVYQGWKYFNTLMNYPDRND